MCLSIKVSHPDHVLSEGSHLGFEWVTVHNGLGYRCGYIRLPKGHPWHGKSYDDVPAEVHGGLTFAQKDVSCDKGGEDDAWWIGFDCAHLGDAQDPSLPAEHLLVAYRMTHGTEPDTIKTTAYVEKECHSLCDQASKAA